jgi:hypothetical protein
LSWELLAALGGPDDEIAAPLSSRSAKDVQDHLLPNAILAVDQAHAYSQVYCKGGLRSSQHESQLNSEATMTMTKTKTLENDRKGEQPAMRTPPIVSPQAWEAARQQMLVKEKALMRARDGLAAERRRMPWMAVEKAYEFEGPQGKVSLLDLFEGRRQLIVYRAFFEPGVFGWPEHACRGCSLGADQVAHLAHLNARDTTGRRRRLIVAPRQAEFQMR